MLPLDPRYDEMIQRFKAAGDAKLLHDEHKCGLDRDDIVIGIAYYAIYIMNTRLEEQTLDSTNKSRAACYPTVRAFHEACWQYVWATIEQCCLEGAEGGDIFPWLSLIDIAEDALPYLKDSGQWGIDLYVNADDQAWWEKSEKLRFPAAIPLPVQRPHRGLIEARVLKELRVLEAPEEPHTGPRPDVERYRARKRAEDFAEPQGIRVNMGATMDQDASNYPGGSEAYYRDISLAEIARMDESDRIEEERNILLYGEDASDYEESSEDPNEATTSSGALEGELVATASSGPLGDSHLRGEVMNESIPVALPARQTSLADERAALLARLAEIDAQAAQEAQDFGLAEIAHLVAPTDPAVGPAKPLRRLSTFSEKPTSVRRILDRNPATQKSARRATTTVGGTPGLTYSGSSGSEGLRSAPISPPRADGAGTAHMAIVVHENNRDQGLLQDTVLEDEISSPQTSPQKKKNKRKSHKKKKKMKEAQQQERAEQVQRAQEQAQGAAGADAAGAGPGARDSGGTE